MNLIAMHSGQEAFQIPFSKDSLFPTGFWKTSAQAMRTKGNVRVVVFGGQGSGKTTLFNKLTGSSEQTSDGVHTCTRVNCTKGVETPAGLPSLKHVDVVDTPGMATTKVHYDDSFQLREALVRKPVNLIVVVMACPTETRSSTAITLLKPLDKIMNCNAFLMDQLGVQASKKVAGGPKSRTKVMLVMTHRDKFNLRRDLWRQYIHELRTEYFWVGPVVLVDTKKVSSSNLIGNIIIPAMCMEPREYSIPMVEFCARFPISRKLSREDQEKVLAKQNEFNTAMVAAMNKFNETKKARVQSGSYSFLEKLGPSLDAVLRFLDDVYERTTLEALADLESKPGAVVRVDDLWTGTDEAVNVRLVEKWNAIKSHFGEAYENNKRILAQAVPTRPVDAIYKRCNHCPCVYVKPVGCDFGTHCGKTVGGSDMLPFTYEYDMRTNRFDIVESSNKCLFEQIAYKFRKNFSDMQNRNVAQFFGRQEIRHPPTPKGAVGFEQGCGREIKWETMIPLSLEELQDYKLVPEYIEYAVTTTETAGTALGAKAELIKNQIGITDDLPVAAVLDRAWTELGLGTRKPSSLMEKASQILAELGVQL